MQSQQSDFVSDKNIIFFDGVCSLCNHLVDYLISRDRAHKLHFASLQGQTASAHLSQKAIADLNTVIYLRKGKIETKSTAVLLALSDLEGAYKLLLALLLVPTLLRDGLYDLVAKNRYSLFGKRDTCRLPSPAEKDYLLP